MKECKKCNLFYDDNLQFCPYCNTNIGIIRQKIIKKNKIEKYIFRFLLFFFVLSFILSIMINNYTHIVIVCLIICIVAYIIIDNLICKNIHKQEKQLLTDEEKKLYDTAIKQLNQNFQHNLKLITEKAKYLSGIPTITNEENCKISCYSDRIVFEMLATAKTINLPYSQILNIGKQTKTEIITTYKNRNTIARGITGGLLFGSTGTILGGLSGVAPKIEHMPIDTNYLCIKYINKNNEENVIILELNNINFILNFLQTKIVNKTNQEIDL